MPLAGKEDALGGQSFARVSGDPAKGLVGLLYYSPRTASRDMIHAEQFSKNGPHFSDEQGGADPWHGATSARGFLSRVDRFDERLALFEGVKILELPRLQAAAGNAHKALVMGANESPGVAIAFAVDMIAFRVDLPSGAQEAPSFPANSLD